MYSLREWKLGRSISLNNASTMTRQGQQSTKIHPLHFMMMQTLKKLILSDNNVRCLLLYKAVFYQCVDQHFKYNDVIYTINTRCYVLILETSVILSKDIDLPFCVKKSSMRSNLFSKRRRYHIQLNEGEGNEFFLSYL